MPQQIEFFNPDGNSYTTNMDTAAKRVRMLKSCLLCRKKKRGCDKAKPVCGTCSKRNEAHLCQYEDTIWNIQIPENPVTYSPETPALAVSNVTPPRIIGGTASPLKIEIAMEEVPDPTTNETIDFNNLSLQNPGTFDHFGTLTWSAITKKDLFVNTIIGSQNPKTALLNSGKDFDSKSHEFFHKWEQENPELFNTSLLKRNKQIYISVFDFSNHLKSLLNDFKLCWYLVDIFFETELCVYLPYIDEISFKQSLSKTLQADGLNIQMTSDLSIIGILLLIMKLSHFFTTFNYGKESSISDDAKIQYIYDHPLSLDPTHLINRIEIELSKLKPYTIEAFQFLLLRQYYNMYAPEECACTNLPSAERLGALLYYANQMSLNRDPLKVLGCNSPSSRINLLRRLWFGLVILDNAQNLLLGIPKVINENMYDTQLPIDESESNVLESTKNKYVSSEIEKSKAFEPLLNMIVPIKNAPTYGKLKAAIKEFNIHIQSLKLPEELKIGNTVPARLQNFCDIKHFLESQLLLFMVYHHLFIHFSISKNKELSVEYLLKLCDTVKHLYSVNSFVFPGVNPQENPRSLFGTGMFIFPLIENGAHKCTLFIMSVLGRIKSLKMFTVNDIPLPISNLLDNILRSSYHITETINSNCFHLVSTYFHPWMTSKMHSTIFHKCLTMPLGPSYNFEKSLIDINIISKLNQYKGYDFGFSTHDLDDFVAISKKFDELHELLDKNNHYSIRADNYIHTNTTPVSNEFKVREEIVSQPDFSFDQQEGPSFNDKKWLDRIIDEFSDGSGPQNFFDFPSTSKSPYYFAGNHQNTGTRFTIPQTQRSLSRNMSYPTSDYTSQWTTPESTGPNTIL